MLLPGEYDASCSCLLIFIKAFSVNIDVVPKFRNGLRSRFRLSFNLFVHIYKDRVKIKFHENIISYKLLPIQQLNLQKLKINVTSFDLTLWVLQNIVQFHVMCINDKK